MTTKLNSDEKVFGLGVFAFWTVVLSPHNDCVCRAVPCIAAVDKTRHPPPAVMKPVT